MNRRMFLKEIGALVLFVVLLGCDSRTAMLQENKEIIGRFTDAINNEEFELLDDLVAEDFVRHSQATPDMEVKSRDQFIELQHEYLKIFPDQKVTIQTMIAEGDYVAVTANYKGTQEGAMPPFPATGNTVESRFISLFRLEQGKIKEMWVEWDNLAILRQLGLFPPPSMTTK